MNKFFNKSKKPYYGPFLAQFHNFGGKKSSPENQALSRRTLYGFLALFQFQESAWTD